MNGVAYDYDTGGSTDAGYNISAPGTPNAGSTGSEMAHMYHNTLGNLSYCDPAFSGSVCYVQPGGGLSNTGLFLNLLSDDHYWSATESAIDSSDAWSFEFDRGRQYYTLNKPNTFYVWAVHDGDVGAAVFTIPPALWLFGSGLLGVIGICSRKKATKY